MSSPYCDWCEKKRDTIRLIVPCGDAWSEEFLICRKCTIAYYEEQIFILKCEQNMIKPESKQEVKKETK